MLREGTGSWRVPRVVAWAGKGGYLRVGGNEQAWGSPGWWECGGIPKMVGHVWLWGCLECGPTGTLGGEIVTGDLCPPSHPCDGCGKGTSQHPLPLRPGVLGAV